MSNLGASSDRKARLMALRRYAIVISKYVLAVLISIMLAIQLDVPDYLSVAFISVLTLQPNLFRGIEFSWQQIEGTALGALVTVALILLTGGVLHPDWWMVQASVAMGITIGLCLYAELDEGTVIAIFTVAYLTCLPKMIPDTTFFNTLHLRFITIGIGLTTGFVLNWGSSLFGYRDRLYLTVRRQSLQLIDRLERMQDVVAEMEPSVLREELRQWRTFRNNLEDVEIDLEQIERRSPTDDPFEIDPEGIHRRQFEVIYVLKDFSHHLWGLLLMFLKQPSMDIGEDDADRLRGELDRVTNLYRRLQPALMDPDSTPPDSSFEDDLEEGLVRVETFRSNGGSRRALRLDVHFINCYETLREAYKLVKTGT